MVGRDLEVQHSGMGGCWGCCNARAGVGACSCPWPQAAGESRDQAGCHRRGAGNKGLFFRV